jgi:hypothetical protein
MEKKTEGAKLSYINSPINGIKQIPVQKKLNAKKYWEMVDSKIKKENAPLFKNHGKLKPPPHKKTIKQEYKSDIQLWVQVCNQPVGRIYNLRHFNNQFWIKHYNNASKIFSLRKNHQLSKKEFIKYCWNRKDAKIFVRLNSTVIEEDWNLNALSQQSNEQNVRRLYYTINFYVNISKLNMSRKNDTTIIELAIKN